MTGSHETLLSVRDLRTEIRRRDTVIHAVDGVSFDVARGETVGVVGETGSGKTMTGLSLMGLLPRGGRVVGGSARFGATELTQLTPAEMRRLRGSQISMIFQDPMTSLNPVVSIGTQIGETVRVHEGRSRQAAQKRAEEMLDLVGMPDPRRQLQRYPHELSGGMRQRAVIAMALACTPKLLIADEPTTALDVTIQEQILTLLDDLKSKLAMGVLLITHDMGVIAGRADRVMVMYAGQVVEAAATDELFADAGHPYAEALLQAIPQIDEGRSQQLAPSPGSPPDLAHLPAGCRFSPRCRYASERCRVEQPPLEAVRPDHALACFHPLSGSRQDARPAVGAGADRTEQTSGAEPLLAMDDIVVEYPVGGGFLTSNAGTVKAVSGVTLQVGAGEVVGLVGESGCGKSTLGRTMVALQRPTSGKVRFDGTSLDRLRGAALRRRRRELQFMFQDPHAALDPRMHVGESLQEPLDVQSVGNRRERRATVLRALDEVGLPASTLDRYPHEFSGGQRQRIGFARALVLRPRLIVADEPVSALDVSVQAQVLNLMLSLQQQLQLTYVIISHDLSVIRYLADRVGVMYLGKLVEIGRSDDVYDRPAHPYTAGLLNAIPRPDPSEARARRGSGVGGELPSALDPPSGCRFRTRCPLAQARCAEEEPGLRVFDDGHLAACHFPLRDPAMATAPVAKEDWGDR